MATEKKSKTLYLKKILEERTDEDHPLSTSQLIDILKTEYGISVHRQTLASDIEELMEFGLDICKDRSSQNKFFVGQRTFELPEIKLLIDAVESSRFITTSKSNELIEKIHSLTSNNMLDKLERHNFIAERVKPDNEKIYYIVDKINDAINAGKQISFHYFTYNEKKQKVLKNNGEKYFLSPYSLVWNEDYYYAVGYSEKHNDIVNFRVDRIETTPEITDIDVIAAPDNFDMSEYIKKTFSMYVGESTEVELLCDNNLMKTMIDRFGEDIKVEPFDDNSFKIKTVVSVSPTFYGWVFGFAGQVKILSPKEIKAEYTQMLNNSLNEPT